MYQFSKILVPATPIFWNFSQFFLPKSWDFSQKVTPSLGRSLPPIAPLIGMSRFGIENVEEEDEKYRIEETEDVQKNKICPF